jgi:predicted metalloprotease with PDZ domain
MFMKVEYVVSINEPSHHKVSVKMSFKIDLSQKKFTLFLPVWSPGSYMVREYSRHLSQLQVSQDNGEVLFFKQMAKNQWEVDRQKMAPKNISNQIIVNYEVYCHELTVRTSFIDDSHAFLHGPSYILGIMDKKIVNPSIEFKFPSSWSKLSTSLKDITDKREKFIYSAKDYEELIDCPVEIGCHETDGFESASVRYDLAFYGDVYPNVNLLKKDFKKIVETVCDFMGDTPFKNYQFITHFSPRLYGGLEHLNSTALHYDGRKLQVRKEYTNFLCLVCHEFFHSWNVKRIRPIELGPFNFHQENYTELLWLAEGLTSFVDEYLVWQSGLITEVEYLEKIKTGLDQYFATNGRKFHSLDESSFNAWIKYYRPDETTKNTTVSYYLKGSLVFLCLHAELVEKGKSIKDFVQALWTRYKENPDQGMTKEEVFNLVQTQTSADFRAQFEDMVSTTQELPLNQYLKKLGLNIVWTEPTATYLGADFDYNGDRVFIKSVNLDSPAYKSGLNAGDEILALNGMRFLKDDANQFLSWLVVNQTYTFKVSRLNRIQDIQFLAELEPKKIKELTKI